MAGAAFAVGAQDDRPGTPPPDPAASAASGPGGSFFGRLTSKVGGIIGSNDARPMLESVKPGVYKVSNEAIGVDVDVESKRVGALGLIRLPAFEVYANDLLASLKTSSGVTDIPGKVYVLASTALEAGSTPDGNIYISVGWINSIESEDELVALLGHELGHVLLRHHDSNVFSRGQKTFQGIFKRSVEFSNQALKVMPQLEVKGVNSSDAASVLKRSQIIVEVTDGAALPAWGRVQEREADKIALDFVDKQGYSTRQGVLVFLDRIRAWEEQLDAAKAKMREELQQSVVDTGQAGNLDEAQKKAVAGLIGSAKDTLSTSHDPADKRIEDITNYREKFYSNAPRKGLKTAAYSAVVKSGDSKPILDAYQQVFSSVSAIEEKRYAEAIDTLTKVTRAGTPIARDAAPNYYLYLSLVGSSKDAEAINALSRSFNATEPSWKPYEATAKYYFRQHDLNKAASTVDAAIARFKNAPALQPELVGIYTQFGWKDKATAVLQDCELKYVSFREACKARSK